MGAQTFVIVNHSAARARAAWGEVRRMLEAACVSFDAHEAREYGDARAQARAAVAAGYRTVAVVGGDGTLGEVVNGFFESTSATTAGGATGVEERDTEAARANNSAGGRSVDTPALALLPAGTGNDFARALEGRRASLLHWIARLIAYCREEASAQAAGDARARAAGETVGRLGGAATTRRVDVLRGTVAGSRGGESARTFYCLNAVTLGVGAEVAARVAAQGRRVRGLSGEARFALAALPAIVGWRERRVRVSVDGNEARELRTNLVAVVNGPFAGGGMMFSPDARVDDGLLDVVTASRLTRAALAREMARVHSGGHVKNPRVSIVRASRVLIEPVTERDALPVEADGDVRGVTPIELSVVPRALRVVI
jgi:diacylglycerol kinase family enzyme